MFRCISMVRILCTNLWRTICKYARKILRIEDVDNDGCNEIVIDINGSPSSKSNINDDPSEIIRRK